MTWVLDNEFLNYWRCFLLVFVRQCLLSHYFLLPLGSGDLFFLLVLLPLLAQQQGDMHDASVQVQLLLVLGHCVYLVLVLAQNGEEFFTEQVAHLLPHLVESEKVVPGAAVHHLIGDLNERSGLEHTVGVVVKLETLVVLVHAPHHQLVLELLVHVHLCVQLQDYLDHDDQIDAMAYLALV